ncbi:MAG: hypothetical protein QM758_06605 [Armatimonas sp.]
MLTPEQNKQWRQAILPSATHLTEERWRAERAFLVLLPPEKQFEREEAILGGKALTNLGVPIWARRLRYAILHWRPDHLADSWITRFLLRSQAALIGIQLSTATPAQRDRSYQRVFVRFVHEALRPFAEWASQPQLEATRRKAYQPLINLYTLCDGFTPPADPEPWRLLFEDLSLLSENRGLPERRQALTLTSDLLRRTLARLSLDQIAPRPVMIRPTWSTHTLFALNRQHQWRLDGQGGESYETGANYTELIADAYITALEAECPSPDWLPQV